MAPLTAAGRKRIPTSKFALPGRKYPIDTPNRARNALARGAQNASPLELTIIRRAVRRKYPEIAQS
jgi:hypothetical protein